MKRNYAIVLAAGAVLGLLAVILVKLGNPPNMGLCVACFKRDIAGALGLFAKGPKYIRPEIIGIVLGAWITALFAKEFRVQGGSAPLTRFLLGMFVMIGALTFLGCPVRMVLRLGGGDLNAVVALVGFILGIAVGVVFLKTGFDLGRAYPQKKIGGWILPLMVVGLLVFLIFASIYKGVPIKIAQKGHPGAPGTPVGVSAGILISLIAGIIVGILAQRSRLCMAGGIRDLILIRSMHLFWGFIGILVVVFIGNLISGKLNLGFEKQPIAHTQHLWNFLGMGLVGLGAVLLGGCPLRQLILAGNGNTDSTLTVLGMLSGAAIAHNLTLVAAKTNYSKGAVILGIIIIIIIGLLNREQ